MTGGSTGLLTKAGGVYSSGKESAEMLIENKLKRKSEAIQIEPLSNDDAESCSMVE